MDILWYILLVLGSYLIGNINFAIFISRKKNNDITKLGSGNPGTMNMLRNFGVKTGGLTLILDVLKGAVPALVGYLTMGETGLYVAGLAVVVGHILPVFRKFKGGKGVACALGVFLVANPLLTLGFFALAFVYLLIFDYGAIASFIVITAMTVIEAYLHAGNFVISLLLFAMFTIIFVSHRQNITRLLIGKENKANLKKSLRKIVTKKEIKQEIKEDKTRDIG